MTDATRAFDSLTQLASAPRIVTIGAFDGPHRGHQTLIQTASHRARELGSAMTVVTFEPLPGSVVRPESYRGRISTASVKRNRILTLDIDELITLEFDTEFSNRSGDDFFEELATSTSMTELWVGEAFAMGKNREGNLERLQELGQERGVHVVAVQRAMIDGEVVSSTRIRKAIDAGDALSAWRWLGTPYQIVGEVIHGAHLGRTIGFPTANIVPPPELVALADGIYSSLAHLADHQIYPSMSYIGTRPTVNSGARLVETHLFDFDGDLYGQQVQVDFLERLRGDEVFDGLDPLIAQLRQDEVDARASIRRVQEHVPELTS